MPKLKKETVMVRTAQIIQAISLMQTGKSREIALRTAGLTNDQYYLWLSKSQEAVDLFYGLIQEGERRELASILSSREKLLESLITRASREGAPVAEITMALSYIDKRQQDLENKQGVADNAEIAAQEYLKGPQTKKQSSRLTATVTFEGPGTVTVSATENQIIEGEARDLRDNQTESQLSQDTYLLQSPNSDQ